MEDELVRTWIIHHVQITGEAAAKVEPAIRDQCPGVPWRQIVAMRNLVVHEYFGVDLDELWSAVDRDLPTLRRQIGLALEELDTGEESR